MKSLKLLVAFFLLMNNIVSSQAITDKWKQLHDYHEMLSKTFHPAEEGNFNPIKNSSKELVAKVEALDVTTMPQDIRTPKVEETIATLKRQTKLVDEMVQKKAPDAELMRAFENLHDIFHRIVQMCEPKR